MSTVKRRPGRSTSTRETVSHSLLLRRRRQADALSRRDQARPRGGARPTGINDLVQLELPVSLRAHTRWPMCGGLKTPPKTVPIRRPAGAHTHLACAVHDVLGRGSARAARSGRGVQLLGRVAHLGPQPNSPLSVNRVDAFTYTQAASTAAVNAPRRRRSAVTIASSAFRRAVDVVDRLLEAVHDLIAIVSPRYSVSQSSSVALHQPSPSRGERPCAASRHLDPARAVLEQPRQHGRREVGVTSRFGRVAHSWPLTFAL